MAQQKYETYYNENVIEDTEEIETICEVARKQLWERFHLKFGDVTKADPQGAKLTGSCFAIIFDAILSKLEELERTHKDYQINIADRLVIGYSTSEDDDDEKQGNFMVFLKHLENNKKIDKNFDPGLSPVQRAVEWNSVNIVTQTDTIREINEAAVSLLSQEIEVEIAQPELIMPIFVTIYDALVSFLKIRRNEKDEFEYEINFMNCFKIGVRENEDNLSDVYIIPNIESKLRLKSDALATSINE